MDEVARDYTPKARRSTRAVNMSNRTPFFIFPAHEVLLQSRSGNAAYLIFQMLWGLL